MRVVAGHHYDGVRIIALSAGCGPGAGPPDALIPQSWGEGMARAPSGQPQDAHIAAELDVVTAREKLADAFEHLAQTEDVQGDPDAANRHRHDAAGQLSRAAEEVDHITAEKARKQAQGNGSRMSPTQWQ